MLIKWGRLATTVAFIGGSVGLMTTTAQAKTSYHITKTQKIARTAYHLKNDKQTRFTWDKTHTKRLWILNQVDSAHQKMTWMADAKVTMKHGNKSATYLHIRDDYGGDDGYVYAKSMVKGYSKGYQTDAPYFCYYRLDAATKVALQAQGKRSVTLPKGTVIQGTTSVSKGRETLAINATALSYHLRHQLGIGDKQTFKDVAVRTLKATPVDQPAYSTVMHDDFADLTAANLFKGTSAQEKRTQLFRTTSDGYVEYYDTGTSQRNDTDLPQGKPVSQKFLRTSQAHGVVTMAYRHHLKGLKDTPTTVKGAAGYQLTLQKPKQTTTIGYGVYANYRVGGQSFYAYQGQTTGSPVTAKKLSAKALAKQVKTSPKMTYYRTTKKVRVRAPFDAYVSGTLKKTITLPKGTVVAGQVVSQRQRGKTVKSMQVVTNRLSTKRLAPGYKKGLWAGQDAATTKHYQSFARVKRPAYMPKNGSAGDLYLGSSTKPITAGKLAKRSVVITTDGYVEVHHNDPAGRKTEYRAKPKTSVKIKRTTIKGHTRYLYLAKKLSGFKTKKVHYHGKAQYRLALFNPQKTYAVNFDPDGDEDGSTPEDFGFLVFGGQSVYTPYELD